MGDHVGVFCEVVGCCSPLYARVETPEKYPVREAAPPHSNEVTGLPAGGTAPLSIEITKDFPL